MHVERSGTPHKVVLPLSLWMGRITFNEVKALRSTFPSGVVFDVVSVG